MIQKRRVSLGGVQLDSLDERILISGIDLAAGKDTITAVGSAYSSGQRITATRRDTLDVTVKFKLAIKNDDMAGRAALLEMINAWAAPGGWLRVNFKEGRRLMVTLAQAPGDGDQFNWTNEFTLVFRAYSLPYWQDSTAASVTSKTAQSGSVQIDVPGSVDTVADVTVTNKSGATINKITMTVGGKQMVFSSLGMTGSQALVIDHIHNFKLFCFRARIGSTSVMAKRTGADDFTVSPGKQTISWSADRAVQVAVSVRGRYL